jgi:hypothetical protein
MDPISIGAVAFAILFVALVIACIKDSRKQPAAPDDLQAKPARVIELPPVNPSHDPTAIYADAADTPEGEPKVMSIPEAISTGAIRQQQEASSFLGFDAPVMPCPAIQEAVKRLADLPPVVAVIEPKKPRKCDIARSEVAEAAAIGAAGELRSNHKRENVAERWGYTSVDSMRKALNRYGYKLNGQPKEAAK